VKRVSLDTADKHRLLDQRPECHKFCAILLENLLILYIRLLPWEQVAQEKQLIKQKKVTVTLEVTLTSR
jgi:hypothetical protein